MATPRTQQFRVELPDGLIIERLPVGLANGHWHLTFVCFGVDFRHGDPPRFVTFTREFRSKVVVTAVAGDLECTGGSGSGGEDEHEERMRFLDTGATAIEVAYLHDGAPIAREIIDLS